MLAETCSSGSFPEGLTPALDNIQKEVLQSETLSLRRASGLKKASFLLSALAAAGFIISSLPFFQQNPSAYGAENSPTSTPTPTSTLTPEAKNKEVKIQDTQNPIEFTYNGQQYNWLRDNARYGIPPNNPNVPTGTIDVKINGNYQYSWQLQQSIYPAENTAEGRSIGIAGQIADTQTGKGYLVTVYGTAAGWKLGIESISAINNPTDYSEGARVLNIEGLENIIVGNYGKMPSFDLKQDSQGKYLEFALTEIEDSSKNGIYRIRLDSQGNFIPPAVKQDATPTPTFTPTLTPTQTPTPTNGTPTLGPVATFGTNRDPETRIHIPVSPRKPSP